MMMLYMDNNASSEMRSQDMSYRAPGAGNDTFNAISFHHNCNFFFFFKFDLLIFQQHCVITATLVYLLLFSLTIWKMAS